MTARMAARIAATCIALAAGPVCATQVNVVGLFGSKALVSIDGAAPRTLSIGQATPEGVKLVSVDGDAATLEIDGKRRTLKMGQHYATTGSSGGSITLKADGQGHFVAQGAINGASAVFLVDTGATLISIPSNEAKRMGINYYNAPRSMVGTANGATIAYKVKLDAVRVGSVTLNNVDALVLEAPMSVTLLGMSFLNRMEMKRDGETMTLTRRF